MDDLGLLLDAARLALDHIENSKKMTIAQALRLTAHFRHTQIPVTDLFPFDPDQLEMAEKLIVFMGEVNKLLLRFRSVVDGGVRLSEVPLLQAAISEAWREARDGKIYIFR
ncbi:hypothetical protein HA052_22640 [Chromobacterium haemolyticum]|uniref:Uncharacterized protein n=1 Tax=Chromobacterium fluminis TaxID=3044269 RepID=A0ABX0LEY7_9NEIS|nr:hypothetical protein [Chromobacterium haemolyticum]NHR07991.1 hypothetical protein [Chromobacterium haemolyticum]